MAQIQCAKPLKQRATIYKHVCMYKMENTESHVQSEFRHLLLAELLRPITECVSQSVQHVCEGALQRIQCVLQSYKLRYNFIFHSSNYYTSF